MANEALEEDEGLSKEVTRFLDKNVGTEKSSTTVVYSLLQDALKKKNCLETELQDSQCRTPDKIQDVLNKGCSAEKEIKNLQQQHGQLKSKVDGHLKKFHPLAERLSSLVSQIAEVERFRAYVSWIQKIESVSCQIHQFVDSGQWNWAVEQLSVLSELGLLLSESACCNLTKFVKEMQLHWQKILLNKLACEFDEIIKALKWPFTSLSTAPPLSTTSDDYSRLENAFILLLKLQELKKTSSEKSSLLDSKSEILLPLDWLLKPFRKRFRFHFYGNKQTNSLEKPEWYFTQVLNWIRNHSDFLQHTIQPILHRTEYGSVDAKSEFICGLLKVVVEKLEHSIPKIIDDDNAFSHFIDELLLFDKELYMVHNYRSIEYGCLHVLTTDACLQRWVELERKYAISNMESVLSSSSAWTLKYKDVGDVDDTRTPECAEGFMTLLSVITDRYRNLPDVTHQEQFLEVQVFLLESFISRLTLEAEETSFAPAGLHYCSVLNSANYINLILQEWSEQMLFLKLCQHHNPSTGSERCNNIPKEESLGDDVNSQERDALPMGSVFEEVTQCLQDLMEDMILKIVEHVVQGFRMLSKPYKKEKWHMFPPPKDIILLTLSSSACEMLLFIKGRLQILQDQLASSIFNTIWKNLAQALNNCIYEEIILECHFNEGGVAQLQFDLTKNLFTLFLEYTQKPENFFKEVKEACILLNLLPGSAVLLRDLLKSSESNASEEEFISPACAALQDAGVYRLTLQDALKVLSLRVHLPSL